ncbi:MAG: extracellular solute-binding protein [Clostridia bacterium]|nr:extracellular solute-binding protein [Clostridia bacterium]
MNLKKYLKQGLSLLLAAFMVASVAGCGGGSSSGGGNKGGNKKDDNADQKFVLADGVDFDKAYGGYDEPVTVTLGVWQRDTDMSYDDNPFIEFLRTEFNIDVKFEWILPWDQHMEKVNMSINAGTLPDAVTIYSTQTVKALLENQSILDLTPYREYFGNGLLEAYSSYENDSCLAEVSVDGKLGALPSTSVGYQHEVLWLRQDWLDVLGLDVPKTLDDVINVAKAFVTQDPDQNGKDDTYGIPYSAYAFGVDNTGGTIDPLFAAMGSFPGAWLKSSDGKTVYGSTTAETKAALSKLAELNSSRIIFCSEDNNGNQIGSGKCGMMFGAWWSTHSMQSAFDANPDATWIATSAPLDTNGNYCIPQISAALEGNGHLIFSPNAKNPEAVIKMKNISDGLNAEPSPFSEDVLSRYKALCESSSNEAFYPIFQQIAPKTAIIDSNNILLDAVESGDKSKLIKHQLVQYDNILKFKDDPYSCNSEEWMDAVNLTIGIPAADFDKLKEMPVNATALPTQFDSKYSNLRALESQCFYEVITGVKTIDAFDNFVSDFKKMGGDEIIAYIDGK